MKRTVIELVDEALDGASGVGDVVALHARLKLLLLAHSPPLLRSLGRIVAAARFVDRVALVGAYRSSVKLALEQLPTRGRHVNALEHMAGYFKRAPAADRQAVADAIAGYARGDVALTVPLAVIRRQATRHGVGYLTQQLYLEAA